MKNIQYWPRKSLGFYVVAQSWELKYLKSNRHYTGKLWYAHPFKTYEEASAAGGNARLAFSFQVVENKRNK